jgi:hypothetical protein
MTQPSDLKVRHWSENLNGAQWRNGAGEGCAIEGGPLRENPLMAHPFKCAVEPLRGHSAMAQVGGS